MNDRKIQKIRDIIQSSNINFLIGAGMSVPFLPSLNDIESRMNSVTTEEEKTTICKEYFEKVMLPNNKIVSQIFDDIVDETGLSDKQKYNVVIKQYERFFVQLADILFERKSTILSKQVNIFTTNIDIFSEKALENSNLNYNDGFSGTLEPIFDISNFKKTIHKKSLHFDNTSEIPIFNLIKVHGSLTWLLNEVTGKISFCKLNHVKSEYLEYNESQFRAEYEKILIVNPEVSKLNKTVLDVIYYELLRFYSAELEKENSVLFVLGFSMNDQHIKEITLRSANSNPTLTIFIFCHSKDSAAAMKDKIGKPRYNNIEIIEPDDATEDKKFNFENINNKLFSQILHIKNSEVKEDEYTS